MPIRFRCAYCNQMMGIATRKAGSVVRCPKCAGEIIVPTPERVTAPPGGLVKPVNATFEDQALDQLFGPAATQPAATDHAGLAPDLLGPERVPHALQGVFLTRGLLILTILAMLVLLGLAFGAGFLIGHAG
jgi:phage FluMu protein Com